MLAAIVAIVEALVAIGEVLMILAGVAALFELLFDPKGKKRVSNLIANIVGGSLDIASTLLGDLEGELAPVARAFVNSLNANGGGLVNIFRDPAAAVAETAYRDAITALASKGESTPFNAVDQAADAIGNAFGFGLASAGVTAAFEALFPEKLNTLNAAGPILAKMAGFDDAAAAIREPLYRNAFGRSLEYRFRSEFKPELPDEQDAVIWHARGLLTDDQLKTIFDFSGLKAEYEDAYTKSAYRAVSPFIMARAMESGALTRDQVFSALTFYGMRPQDQDALLAGYTELALKPYKDRALAAAVIANERGNISDADLTALMDDMKIPADGQGWVHIAVAHRKLEQLAELYRKSVDEAYTYGLITDADYVPHLEAIGIAAADAEAHYAIVSFKKQGRALAAAEREAARAASQVRHAAIAAAIADYEAGNVDAGGLAAALAAAGMNALIIPYVVAYQEARRLGRRRNIAGLLLDPQRAVGMRERIALVKEQVTKKLITPDAGYAQLTDAGIPAANAQLIIGEAAAAAKIVWP